MNKFLQDLLGLIGKHQSEFNQEELEQFLATIDKTKVKTLNFTDVQIVENKSVAGELYLRAIASTPSIDRGNDVVIAKGITTPNLKSDQIPMLYNHDHDIIIGSWTKWFVQDDKFVVEGYVKVPTTQAQKDIHENIKSKVLNGTSVSFIPIDAEVLKSGVTVYHKIELLEISVVTIPMNQDAYITDVIELKSKSVSEENTKTVVSEVVPANEPAPVDSQGDSPVEQPKPTTDEVAPAPQDLPNSSQEDVAKLTEEIISLKQRVEELTSENQEMESLITEANDALVSLNTELSKRMEGQKYV